MSLINSIRLLTTHFICSAINSATSEILTEKLRSWSWGSWVRKQVGKPLCYVTPYCSHSLWPNLKLNTTLWSVTQFRHFRKLIVNLLFEFISSSHMVHWIYRQNNELCLWNFNFCHIVTKYKLWILLLAKCSTARSCMNFYLTWPMMRDHFLCQCHSSNELFLEPCLFVQLHGARSWNFLSTTI